MLDTLIKGKAIIVVFNTEQKIILTIIVKKPMKENSKDYQYCIKAALDNAKERINLLQNSDRNCVVAEYKEWIKEGISNNTVLLLREDPII